MLSCVLDGWCYPTTYIFVFIDFIFWSNYDKLKLNSFHIILFAIILGPYMFV